MIRVLLVEDHRTLAEALELALRAAGDIEIVGSAPTIAAAVRLIVSARPQVVLADHHLPDGDVGRLASGLDSIQPRPALVILTADSSDAAMAVAVEAGASGHLLKTAGLEEITRAVRRAADGELVLQRAVLLAALRHRTQARKRESVALTEREHQVLALMAEGTDSQGIADRLGVSLHTARDHAQAVLEKLDARSRLQAVARAYELGLLGPPGRAPPPAIAGWRTTRARDARAPPVVDPVVMARQRFLTLIDAALLLVLALMATTEETVVLFHLIFVLLGVGAFFWSFRAFALHAAVWVTVASAEVVLAITGGRTQPDELIEIPLLSLLLVVVFAIASRERRQSETTEAALTAHSRTQAALAEFARSALSSADLTDVFRSAAQIARTVLAVDRVTVVEKLGADRFTIRAIAGRPMPVTEVELPLDDGSLVSHVLGSDGAVAVHDWLREHRFALPAPIHGDPVRSSLAVAVRLDGRPYGALSAHSRSVRDFRTDDLDTLSAIGHVLGAAIARHRATQSLTASERRAAATFRSNPAMLAVFGSRATILEANDAFARALGRPVAELVGRTADELGLGPGPEGIAALREEVMREGSVRDRQVRLSMGPGPGRHALISLEVLPGPERRILMTALDVTERVEAEQMLRATVDGSLDAIVTMELDGRIVGWNPQAERSFGHTRDEVMGRELAEIIIPPMLRSAHRAGLARLRSGEPSRLIGQRVELDALHRDGRVFPAELSITRFELGGRQVFSGFIRDISAQVSQREQLERLALYDPLTGLANRTLLRDRLALALTTAQRTDGRVALAVLDVDRFKGVNDSLGHPAGDDLLVQLAGRLRSTMRPSDLLARLGGDEFAVILEDISDESDAVARATRMRAALADHFEVEGHPVHVGGSVGIALATGLGQSDTMLREADIAMYAAKRSGLGVMLYDTGLDRYGAEELALAAELHEALAGGRLRVEYQPIVDVTSGACTRVEALARWDHPERGPVAPNTFIPIAEQSALIERLGAWVLETALEQAAAWQRDGLALGVSVNVSLRELHRSELVEGVERLLAASGLSPHRLTLEITETAVLGEPSLVIAALHRLRALGVRIAIDDFGTGYASLAYLERLPVDEVKVDRSFVSTSAREPSRLAIVRATIQLAHSLGLDVVGEGVEDEDTWHLLQELGCDEVQGFWTGRPAQPTQLPTLLAASRLRECAPGRGITDAP